MKKAYLFFMMTILGVMAICSMPVQTHALKVSNFEHSYTGTWVKSYDTDDEDGIINETGTVAIDIYTLDKTGKISYAYVTFDDADSSYFATGYIYKKHGKSHIILNYSTLSSDSYIYGLSITGHITKNKINGTYDHYDQYYDQYWGGTIKAVR